MAGEDGVVSRAMTTADTTANLATTTVDTTDRDTEAMAMAVMTTATITIKAGVAMDRAMEHKDMTSVSSGGTLRHKLVAINYETFPIRVCYRMSLLLQLELPRAMTTAVGTASSKVADRRRQLREPLPTTQPPVPPARESTKPRRHQQEPQHGVAAHSSTIPTSAHRQATD